MNVVEGSGDVRASAQLRRQIRGYQPGKLNRLGVLFRVQVEAKKRRGLRNMNAPQRQSLLERMNGEGLIMQSFRCFAPDKPEILALSIGLQRLVQIRDCALIVLSSNVDASKILAEL